MYIRKYAVSFWLLVYVIHIYIYLFIYNYIYTSLFLYIHIYICEGVRRPAEKGETNSPADRASCQIELSRAEWRLAALICRIPSRAKLRHAKPSPQLEARSAKRNRRGGRSGTEVGRSRPRFRPSWVRREPRSKSRRFVYPRFLFAFIVLVFYCSRLNFSTQRST